MVEFTVGKQGINNINKQGINLTEKIFPNLMQRKSSQPIKAHEMLYTRVANSGHFLNK